MNKLTELAKDLDKMADDINVDYPQAFKSPGGHDVCEDLRKFKRTMKDMAKKTAQIAKEAGQQGIQDITQDVIGEQDKGGVKEENLIEGKAKA